MPRSQTSYDPSNDLCPKCGSNPHLEGCAEFVSTVPVNTPPDDMEAAHRAFPNSTVTKVVRNDRAKINEAIAELARRDKE